MRGIDVSAHNGDVNMKAVKDAGYDFVIIRAGYGKYRSQKDQKFEANYLNAVKAGLHVGAYWYSYATTGDEALEEAKVFAEVVQNKIFDMPLFLDIEEAKAFGRATEIVHAFCGYMESKNFYVGIYSSKSPLETYMPGLTGTYCGWVAQWADKCTYKYPYKLWQKSEKGRVTGVNGYVDLDECYDDQLPITIQSGGYNGYPKGGESEKSDVHTVEVYIDGKKVFEETIPKGK